MCGIDSRIYMCQVLSSSIFFPKVWRSWPQLIRLPRQIWLSSYQWQRTARCVNLQHLAVALYLRGGPTTWVIPPRPTKWDPLYIWNPSHFCKCIINWFLPCSNGYWTKQMRQGELQALTQQPPISPKSVFFFPFPTSEIMAAGKNALTWDWAWTEPFR